MATVVNVGADRRGEILGSAFGGGLAKQQQANLAKQRRAEFEALLTDPNTTPEQAQQAAFQIGLKPDESIAMGDMVRDRQQREATEGFMGAIADASSVPGVEPHRALADALNEFPGADPRVVSAMGKSPLLQSQMEEVSVFDDQGSEAKVKIPRGLHGEARLASVENHAINDGGGTFSLADPNKKLSRLETELSRDDANARSKADRISREGIAARSEAGKDARVGISEPKAESLRINSLVTDAGIENPTSIHKGRAARYLKERPQRERTMDDDFGKPPEQSFTEWDAPQTVRHGLQVAKVIYRDAFIKSGKASTITEAIAEAKEQVQDGSFLQHFGVDIAKATPTTMIQKMKTLQFTVDEVKAIMTQRGQADQISEATMKNLITQINKIFGVKEAETDG